MAVRSVVNPLVNSSHHYWYIPWESSIKNCMQRQPQVISTLPKKIFMFLHALNGTREFNNRQYYFCGFVRSWQPLAPEMKNVMVEGFLPFMHPSHAASNDLTYRTMQNYLPFNMLRRSDVRPLGLKRLAKDVIRKEIEKKYDIAANIKFIYQTLRKNLPRQTSSYILHISDSDWLVEWEPANSFTMMI